jgi:Kip1 ubiquitination-promoting complex protein 1
LFGLISHQSEFFPLTLDAMQKLLKEACINDEALFSSFLNRLFNTLSWAMTEFSVSVREMQEKYQV